MFWLRGISYPYRLTRLNPFFIREYVLAINAEVRHTDVWS